jgi:hypothetical protein
MGPAAVRLRILSRQAAKPRKRLRVRRLTSRASTLRQSMRRKREKMLGTSSSTR